MVSLSLILHYMHLCFSCVLEGCGVRLPSLLYALIEQSVSELSLFYRDFEAIHLLQPWSLSFSLQCCPALLLRTRTWRV